MSSATSCWPCDSPFASADTASSSGTIANALVGQRVVLALERGQREQVLDQALHARRLLAHELQEARALPLVELELLQRLDEAADHGQRRLELVRHVGDEVAPHARHRLELRDVARDQELLGDAERHDLDRERDAESRCESMTTASR